MGIARSSIAIILVACTAMAEAGPRTSTTYAGPVADPPTTASTREVSYDDPVVPLSAISTGQNSNFNGYRPFPGSGIYNDISGNPVQATYNGYFQAAYGGAHLNPNFQNGADLPYYVVDSATTQNIIYTPSHGVGEGADTTSYNTESDDTIVPIVAGMQAEGGVDPSTCYTQDNSDHHLLIIDRSKGLDYETYQARTCNGILLTYATSVWDLSKPIENQHPNGRTSADAAGLPILSKVLGVNYEEVAAGAINHALRVTFPQTSCAFYRNGCVGLFASPAMHASATNGGNPKAFFGMRVRLKSTFDTSGFSPTNKILLTAMKKYGFIVADNGCAFCFQGTYDSRFNYNDLNNLATIAGSNFEVVDPGTTPVGADLPQEDAAAGVSRTNNQTGIYDGTTIGPEIPNSPVPPTITNFTAAAPSIALGSSTTLNLTSTNGTVAYIDHAFGNPLSGPLTVSPQQTTTYTATVLGANGYAVSAPVTVTVLGPTVATPTASLPSGTYSTPQTVTLVTTTSGATIHYTTDGSNPTASSATYSGPISVSSLTTLKAIATETGYINSSIATYRYIIRTPGATPAIIGNSSTAGFADTYTTTLTYEFSAGDSAVISLGWVNTTALPTAVTCGSTAATLVKSQASNSSWTAALYLVPNVAAGSQTCSATWATAIYGTMHVTEISGSSGVDASSSGNTETYPNINCGSLTTTGANRLVLVSGVIPYAVVTASPNYTQLFSVNNFGGAAIAVPSATTLAPTLNTNQSGDTTCVAVALQPTQVPTSTPSFNVEEVLDFSALANGAMIAPTAFSSPSTGQAWTDKVGGVWAIANGQLIGRSTAGTDYADHYLYSGTSTDQVNQRIVASFTTNQSGKTFSVLRFQRSIGVGAAYICGFDPPGNLLQLFAMDGSGIYGYHLLGNGTSYVYDPTHTYDLSMSASGSSPTTLSIVLTDTTTNTPVSTLTIADGTSYLQTAGAFALDISVGTSGNSGNIGSLAKIITSTK